MEGKVTESVSDSLKYVMSTIKSSFLPALFFAGGLIIFYAQNPFANDISLSLHTAFYIFAFLGILLLVLVNQSKPFFSFIAGTISYVFLNLCKNTYGADYQSSAEYLWLCFILPLDLLLFYSLLDAIRLQVQD